MLILHIVVSYFLEYVPIELNPDGLSMRAGAAAVITHPCNNIGQTLPPGGQQMGDA